jgi:DNA-binding NtrC family response regulator
VADVVALVDDLIFQSKLIETAKHVGVSLRTCSTCDAFASELKAATPGLLIIDLNAKSDALEAVGAAKSAAPGVRLVAFVSHVETDLAERASLAGCAEVMPRSKFTRQLATILARAKSQPP